VLIILITIVLTIYNVNNLRWATNSENNYNSNKLAKNNKTGVKGVIFYKNLQKYRAVIQFNEKSIHLGYFDKLEDARVKKAKELFGEFLNTCETVKQELKEVINNKINELDELKILELELEFEDLINN